MQNDKNELAKYIMDLKIAKEIKENSEKNFEAFMKKIKHLKEERSQIYINNEEVINKILNVYLEEVKSEVK